MSNALMCGVRPGRPGLTPFALLAAITLLLAGCGGEPPLRFGPQTWQDISVFVETRPSPPRAGMNEFLVVATRKDRSHAWQLIVSLRTNPADDWRQAIQDGHVGVYRKALPVEDPAVDVLYLQVLDKRSGQTGELRFPLNQGH